MNDRNSIGRERLACLSQQRHIVEASIAGIQWFHIIARSSGNLALCFAEEVPWPACGLSLLFERVLLICPDMPTSEKLRGMLLKGGVTWIDVVCCSKDDCPFKAECTDFVCVVPLSISFLSGGHPKQDGLKSLIAFLTGWSGILTENGYVALGFPARPVVSDEETDPLGRPWPARSSFVGLVRSIRSVLFQRALFKKARSALMDCGLSMSELITVNPDCSDARVTGEARELALSASYWAGPRQRYRPLLPLLASRTGEVFFKWLWPHCITVLEKCAKPSS